MVTAKVRWEEMFPDELNAAFERRPVVYLTYGLCEPHGPYNAVGLDALKVHRLACRAAEAHGGIVAPPFFWHVHEFGIEAKWAHDTIGDHNPWLTDVPPWVLYRMFLYHLRAAAARGFQAAIVLSGHAPYGADLRQIAEVFARHSPLRIWAGEDAEAVAEPSHGGGHAGKYETSMLWALCPDLVDISRLERKNGEVDRGFATGRDAEESSRRLGERLVAERVAWLGRKADELLGTYRAPKTPASPTPGNPLGALTFDDIERIWRDEFRPNLTALATFRQLPPDERVAIDSPWVPNEVCALYD
jgi:creatinine amidohydrolase